MKKKWEIILSLLCATQFKFRWLFEVKQLYKKLIKMKIQSKSKLTRESTSFRWHILFTRFSQWMQLLMMCLSLCCCCLLFLCAFYSTNLTKNMIFILNVLDVDNFFAFLRKKKKWISNYEIWINHKNIKGKNCTSYTPNVKMKI